MSVIVSHLRSRVNTIPAPNKSTPSPAKQMPQCDFFMWSFRDYRGTDVHTRCTRVIGVSGNPPRCPPHRHKTNPQLAPLHIRKQWGDGGGGGGGGGGGPGAGAGG